MTRDMQRHRRLKLNGWWVLWAILGIGLLLRIGLMLFYTPTIFNYHGGDSARYLRLSFTGVTPLFGDSGAPAGYPAFLDTMRFISAWLPFTVIVQHLLGLATALLLYGAVTRAGAPRWAALLPAIVVVFSGDHLFLEHGIFSEALWMPALALAMYLIASAISSSRPTYWLVLGGAALAISALFRNASDVLPVVLAVWAAFAIPGTRSVRLRNALALLVPAAIVIGTYALIAEVAGGYTGLYENGGLSLYGRVAQFADCSKFTPPSGTSALCDDTPPTDRPGPFFWIFDPQSPIHTKLHIDALNRDDQALLSGFARAAVISQPLDYAWAAATDFARFFVPSIGSTRPGGGTGPEAMSFASTVPTAQGVTLPGQALQYSILYDGVGDGEAPSTSRDLWGWYQSLIRVSGYLTLLLIALAITGWVFGKEATRAGASLFLIGGLVLLAVPVLFSSYDPRYAVPSIDLFAAGAAFGLAPLVQRIRDTAGAPPRREEQESVDVA